MPEARLSSAGAVCAADESPSKRPGAGTEVVAASGAEGNEEAAEEGSCSEAEEGAWEMVKYLQIVRMLVCCHHELPRLLHHAQMMVGLSLVAAQTGNQPAQRSSALQYWFTQAPPDLFNVATGIVCDGFTRYWVWVKERLHQYCICAWSLFYFELPRHAAGAGREPTVRLAEQPPPGRPPVPASRSRRKRRRPAATCVSFVQLPLRL